MTAELIQNSTPNLIVWIALVSGFCHAAWNALAKRTSHPQLVTLAILQVASLWTWGAVLVFHLCGAKLDLPVAAWPYVLMAALGETSYVFWLGRAYARGDLALTYALTRALALVVVWPLSWLFFGSTPTSIALLGTILVGLGIFWLRKGDDRAEKHHTRVALFPTVATACSIAIYHSGYKGSVNEHASPILAFAVAITIALPLLFLLHRYFVDGASDLQAMKQLGREPKVWLAGLLCAISFTLLVIALEFSESGRILGFRNSSVGFAALFAVWMGERLGRRQLLALMLLVLGIVTLVFDQP